MKKKYIYSNLPLRLQRCQYHKRRENVLHTDVWRLEGLSFRRLSIDIRTNWMKAYFLNYNLSLRKHVHNLTYFLTFMIVWLYLFPRI